MDISYEIELYNYWHCGSGLAAGADVDMLVIKDNDDLPFIPGKTIKGLVREAVEDIAGFSGEDCDDRILRTFGNFDAAAAADLCQGEAFFSDALLSGGRRQIIEQRLAKYMFAEVASTAIGADGVALPHSLRKMEVALPCVLKGTIMNVPDDCAEMVKRSLGYIKRIGKNRNRGLGRARIYIKD